MTDNLFTHILKQINSNTQEQEVTEKKNLKTILEFKLEDANS